MTGKKKKKHNLKFESYVLLWDVIEDCSLENSLSVISEGLFQRVKERARIYRRFYWEKKHVVAY